MALDFNVNLAPQVAMQMIDNGIVNGSLSGERIDYYEVHNTAGYLCITAVYEKFYYRAGNRLTLTVIIDNMRGTTHANDCCLLRIARHLHYLECRQVLFFDIQTVCRE